MGCGWPRGDAWLAPDMCLPSPPSPPHITLLKTHSQTRTRGGGKLFPSSISISMFPCPLSINHTNAISMTLPLIWSYWRRKNIHKVCQTRGRGGASNFFRRLYPFPCSFPCLYMSISKNHVNVIFMPMTLMSILIFNTMTTVQYGDDDGVSDD